MRLSFQLFMFTLVLGSMTANSQETKKVSLGVSAGYRINSGSFFIDYRLGKKIVLTNEYGLDKYQGLGVGLGITYYPLQEHRIKPLVAVSYFEMFGSSFSYDRGNNVLTIFNVSDGNYIVPVIGIKYDGLGMDEKSGVFFSILLRVGYKITSFISPTVSYVSGPTYDEKLNSLNKYVSNTAIGSIGLMLNFIKKKELKMNIKNKYVAAVSISLLFFRAASHWKEIVVSMITVKSPKHTPSIKSRNYFHIIGMLSANLFSLGGIIGGLFTQDLAL